VSTNEAELDQSSLEKLRVAKIVTKFPANDVQQHGSFPDLQEPAKGHYYDQD
jgi:hypothetical protein